MGLTTSLFTGLSGLNAHSQKLDVVGNNISNVNTTAFKGTDLFFQAYKPREFDPGSAPQDTTGGTNPFQVGFGVRSAATLRDWRPGSIQVTGDPRDLAIDGQGLFAVQRNGQQFYSRDGAFRPDANDQLVNINGDVLLGYPVDASFNVMEGALGPITIPIGQLNIAQATSRAELNGNLNAGGEVATAGGIERLLGSDERPLVTVSTADSPFGTGSLLTEIEDPERPGSDVPLFSEGQRLTFQGVQRGGVTVPTFGVAIGAGTTVADVLSAINTALGVDTGAMNPDGSSPGAQVNAATGSIDIVSRAGTLSDIDVDASDVRLTDAGGGLVRLPFAASEVRPATGESGRTTVVAFDSLGNAVEVEVAFTLEEKSSSGTRWRYDLFSNDDLGPGGPLIGGGTVRFDTQGELASGSPISVSLDRAGAGADSPLSFEIALAGESGRMTALSDNPSEFNVTARDGLPPGTLREFGVAADGRIEGAFSNGATRVLGQVVVATFVNYQGLVDLGNSLFQPGANSGPPVIVEPGQVGSGEILSGALEQSNVDLGQEFIDLILTSTGYTASSRVISTSDELMQQLLVLVR